MKMTFTRRAACALAALALSSMASTALAAYPDKPIRIVVGFPAGQATDIIARMAARK